MNTRSRGVFTTQPFVNSKHVPSPSGSLEKHQESTYHKIAVQNLSFRQQEGSEEQQLRNVSELERLADRKNTQTIIIIVCVFLRSANIFLASSPPENFNRPPGK